MSQDGVYSDSKFTSRKQMNIGASLATTCADAGTTEWARMTMMTGVSIQDFNASIITGATNTSGDEITLLLKTSLGGTGSLATIGTSGVIYGTAGVADGAVVDGSVTETAVVSGDDLVITNSAGTSLPADSVTFSAYVLYVEDFV